MPQTTFPTIAGKKTQLTIGGSGPPLLYLHSAGGETEWMPFHAKLAEHFTVHLPAHPGFADSKGLEQVRDVADLAWHYADFLAEQNLGPLPIVGFSLGAWIAVELAILRPQLVSKLILVNAAGIRIEGAKMGELFTDDLNKLRRLLFFDPNDPSADLAMPKSFEDARIIQWLRAAEATARVAWNPYLHNPRLPAHLRRITCPTLVLWGRNDQLFPLPYGEFLAQNIPGAQLEVFDDCGHMLPFEKSAQFVASTTKFLRAK
jgi:pimeloyl-ACP methyl ester carboxylesterase